MAESFHDLKRRLTLLGSAEKRSVRLSRAAVCALLLLTAVAIPGIGLAARPANAAAPAVASAGISCEQEIKIPASERLPASVSRGLWYISGNKMRMDTTKNPTGKGPLGFVIYRWDLGKVYFINPEKLVALEAPLPVDAIKEAQEKARQEVEVTKTDETRKIGEYLCTRYDLTLNGRTEHYWVTSVGDVGPELDTLWDRISPKAVKVAEEAKKQMPHPFPVLRESVGRLSGGTVTDTFSNLRKLEIQDSMFEVPAGYRTVPMPRTSSELREQMEAVETAPSEARIPGSEAAAARTLRFLAAAQNTFVVRCFVDQDGDGHGEYGALRELCGSAVPRGRKEALVAGEVFLGVLGKVTAKDFATAMGKVNNMGIVTKGGYCCIVYLPTHAGPAISEDAGDGPVADPSNAEPQETRWCAYAWPKEYGVTGRRVFVINWQAEVNVASNQRPDGRPLYSGDGTNAGDVIPKPGAALIPNEGREQNLDGHLIPAGTRFQSTVVSSHKGSDGQEWSLPQR